MRITSIAALALLVGLVHSQELSVAKAAAQIDTTIPWITDGYVPLDQGNAMRALPKTEVDRAAMLDGALAKAATEKKLVLWYIPRIEGVQMYRPQLLDDYMRATAFTDPGAALRSGGQGRSRPSSMSGVPSLRQA